jgi:predicted ATPase
MNKLILDSLQIRNFRAFQHLEVPSLGNVNLIVGKNNTGKSSLLEALYIYAREGYPDAIWNIMRARGESGDSRVRREEDIEQRVSDIKHILHNRSDLTETQKIRIGSLQQENRQLHLSIGWHTADSRGNRTEQATLFEEPDELFLVVQAMGKPEVAYNLVRYSTRLGTPEETKGIKYVRIPASGIGDTTIGRFWDRITLTELDKEVIQALKIIEPTIEALSFIEGRSSTRREPFIRTSHYNDRLPLRSLGEGVNRLLGIVLALVNATDGLLLIDEIESGLHYSIQPEMWQLVFRIASELNIQVFATTHSKDCIEAFQKVASKHPKEGVLIRLGRKNDDIVASVFEEEDLEIAIEQDVEVR